MNQLKLAILELKQTLGDFLDRKGKEGIFCVQTGGPHAVSALADLDMPEIQVVMLPTPMTTEQKEKLSGLKYIQQDQHTWLHPQGWRLVFPDYRTGSLPKQQALINYLQTNSEAAEEYRHLFIKEGRQAADQAFQQQAFYHYVQTVGFKPAAFVVNTLKTFDFPWMFAGGIALDLHLGRVLRPHEDIDIAVCRSDQSQRTLMNLLKTWRLDASLSGIYHAWTEPLQFEKGHQVHARHTDLPSVMMLDLLFTDLSNNQWHFRRHPSITRPLDQARLMSKQGLPYLAPEIVLLFKSNKIGETDSQGKDAQDFEKFWPILSQEAKNWLYMALSEINIAHPWLLKLKL